LPNVIKIDRYNVYTALDGCMVMVTAGIPQYPRIFRSNGVECGSNTMRMELEIAVAPWGWN